MNANHLQPHYTPSPVGALMDTAFLRNAAREAHGDRREATSALVTLRQRWQGAIHSIGAAFKRH
ncbi:MAG: hypothetical protein ABI460_16310 [Caldimonas sp.]